VESGAVGVVRGDGDAGGIGSADEQPEEDRVRTAKRKVIHRLLNIAVSFKGFDQGPNCGEDYAAAPPRIGPLPFRSIPWMLSLLLDVEDSVNLPG
jgi:hypothetical protein